MRSLFTALVVVGLTAATSWVSFAQGGEPAKVQLLPPAQVSATGAVSTDVVPVRFGYGWRGYSYYPGWGRPYYGGGYRGGYYGGYGYRPYYGGYYGGYRGWYGPGVGIGFY